MFALAILYRFGDWRTAPKWQWVSYGAVAATVVFIVDSFEISYYAVNCTAHN
jgi:membrane protein